MEHDDDPEKRIAELGRMQGQASTGRPVEQPPAYPPASQPGLAQATSPYPAQPQPSWPKGSGWPQQSQPWQPPVGQSGYGSPPDYRASLPGMSPAIQGRRSRGKGWRAKGWIVHIVFMCLIALLLVGLGGNNVYAYAVGTPTTAKVDNCTHTQKRKNNKTSCTGTWTIDGAVQHGPVHDTTPGKRVGSMLSVRVHDGAAYTLRGVWKGLGLTALGAVFGFVVAPLMYFWHVRKRRRLG